MKKSLLIASMALAAITPALAVTDGSTYKAVNGFTCTNKWIDSRNDNLEGWQALPFAEQYAKARTACLGVYNGKDAVIVGFSQTITVGEDSNDYAHLVIIDFATGDVLKTVQMTCDGEPVKGLLCANQVGCDQFGHVWFAGYVASVYNAETQAFTPLNIYVVDDLDKGTCHKEAALVLPSDETDFVGRIDYCDLVGDITRKEAGCVVMTALNGGETTVLAWGADQGSDKWEGALDGYTSAVLAETYPADQTNWGTAPMVRIVLDDEYSNNLFYVDGFTTCPTLYNNSGSMVDSFASAVELAPKPGTNGVGEFALAGKNFMAYSVGQYDYENGCPVNVVELGENQAFEGMELYWTVPANGLGTVSDGGTRIHSVETKLYTDAAGKEGAYLLTYKCNNGLGVYAIGEEGWEDPNQGAVNDVIADEDLNAPVEYFNLNGVAVDGNNLPAGLYITRQGKTVNKVVVK